MREKHYLTSISYSYFDRIPSSYLSLAPVEVIGFELDPSDFGYDKITDLFRSPQLDQTIALEIKDNGTIVLFAAGLPRTHMYSIRFRHK